MGTQTQPLMTLAPVTGHAACTWDVPRSMEKTEPVSSVCVSSPEKASKPGEAGIVDSSALWLMKLNSSVAEEFTKWWFLGCAHAWKYLRPVCTKCSSCPRHHAKRFLVLSFLLSCRNSWSAHHILFTDEETELKWLAQHPVACKWWSPDVRSDIVVLGAPSTSELGGHSSGCYTVLFIVMVSKCIFISDSDKTICLSYMYFQTRTFIFNWSFFKMK